MGITFTDLVTVYKKSEFIENSDKAHYRLDTVEELSLLKKLTSDNNYDITSLDLVDENPSVGTTITLNIDQPLPSFGRIFDTLEDFIRGDMAQIHREAISQSGYYIKSLNASSIDEDMTKILLNYQSIKSFLNQLITMDSYTDSVNKRLVFFSKKTFELSVDISKRLPDFIKLITELDQKQCQIIADFQNWLDDEDTSHHIDEKKSILAFVLSDALPKNSDLIDLIKQIESISESVQAQYALYLENFSYEKFVKKLEENSEKFVTKINDTISKVLPQFLALPFLIAIPTALKSADNWLVYLAMMLYCIMCILGLNNQNAILNHIKTDVTQYDSKGKVPEKLKAQWKKDKIRIDILIKKQKHLYYFLFTSVLFFLGYASFKLTIYILDYSSICYKLLYSQPLLFLCEIVQ